MTRILVQEYPGNLRAEVAYLQLDIKDALGVKVDLCTERALHPT